MPPSQCPIISILSLDKAPHESETVVGLKGNSIAGHAVAVASIGAPVAERVAFSGRSRIAREQNKKKLGVNNK
jgi:hypothetical protein